MKWKQKTIMDYVLSKNKMRIKLIAKLISLNW